MIVRGFVAAEAMTGRIDLNFNLCALRLAQRPCMLERRDGILVAEVHQHRTTRLFRRVRSDLRTVVTDCACNPLDMTGGAPGDRAPPTVTERRNLAGVFESRFGCCKIGEGLFPR